MQRSSEFPLFLQTGAAIAAFLLVLTLFAWVTTPKTSIHGSATLSSAEVVQQ